MYKYIDFNNRGNWATISDNKNNLVYVQYNSTWDSFSISTLHKPSRDNGTGFQLVGENDGICSSNIEKTIILSFGKTPNWAKGNPVKYNSIEQYLEYQQRFWDDAHIIEVSSLRVIIDDIKNQHRKIINCNGYCKKCNTNKIHYGIESGSYNYFCNTCYSIINKNDVITEPDYTTITLGQMLTNKNETIKRNAMSILKTLQK